MAGRQRNWLLVGQIVPAPARPFPLTDWRQLIRPLLSALVVDSGPPLHYLLCHLLFVVVGWQEGSVLECLLQRIGKVVSKDQITQAVAGWSEALSENAIEVYVSRLRGKIETADLRIRTVRGFGYMLEEAAHDA